MRDYLQGIEEKATHPTFRVSSLGADYVADTYLPSVSLNCSVIA